MPRCEAASISTTSSAVPAAIARAIGVVGSKSAFGPPSAFSAFARILAIDVFPVPRGPAKRYAWRTWSCSIAFRSVRTTASCPTTCEKSSER